MSAVLKWLQGRRTVGIEGGAAQVRAPLPLPPVSVNIGAKVPTFLRPPANRSPLAEADRVCALAALPRDEDGKVQRALARPGCTESLNSVQEEMLWEAAQTSGLLAFASTGSGKAWCALLLGSMMPDVEKVMIFAPSGTLANLRAEKLRLRTQLVVHPKIRLHSYETMQRPTPEGRLDYLEEQIFAEGGKPETTLLVFDEAHALKNLRTSARAMRAVRCKLKHPSLRVCALSGSMTESSILECAHLAWMALGDKAPFPAPWLYPPDLPAHADAVRVLHAWSACLDKDGEPDGADWRAFAPLWFWAHPDKTMADYGGAERRDLARKAFQHRMRTASGVVLTRSTSAKDVALVVHGLYPEAPDTVLDAMTAVDEQGTDPDGNVVPDATSAWRVKRQLAQGFYYVWDWPTDIATGRPRRDEPWLQARSQWNRHVRQQIRDRGTTGYDSALLVYSTVGRKVRHLCDTDVERAWVDFVSRACKDEHPGVVSSREKDALHAWLDAGGDETVFAAVEQALTLRKANDELLAAWLTWSARQKHKPRPPTKAIWISEYLVDAAVQWLRTQNAEGFKGVVWYDFAETGKALGRRGLPVYGAGTTPPQVATDVALSLQVHSEGKNLQAWSRMLVLCPPSSGRRWEQCLARLHRTGQKAVVVRCWVNAHVQEFREALAAARAAADYVQAQTGNEQKLLVAAYQDLKLPRVAAEKFGQTVQAGFSFQAGQNFDEWFDEIP